jgi:hypothetical protein
MKGGVGAVAQRPLERRRNTLTRGIDEDVPASNAALDIIAEKLLASFFAPELEDALRSSWGGAPVRR